MADENDLMPARVTEPATVVTAPEVKTPAAKKPRASRGQKAKVESVRVGPKVTAPKSPGATQKKHNEQEKLEKLKLIDAQLNEGASTLKDAAKNAGISEQTYYNWKRTEMPVESAPEQSGLAGDELADLIQLEEENHRLRKLLAEKLRSENAELRRRLGLD